MNLGGRNLWYDEAFAVLFAEKGLDAMLYGTLTPVAGGASDIHPLLYYATLNAWMTVFGQSPLAVRLLSVIFGVATVYVMYRLGRALLGERTGLATALITAIAPFQVQYSQEARMYALLGLLLALATLCFIKAWRAEGGRGIRWWLAFGVLSGLSLYTQQLAAFYLAALGLIPFILRQRTAMIGVGMGTAVAVVIYLPWLVNLPAQFAKVRSYYWLSPPNIAQPLLTARSFLVVNLDIPAPFALIGLIGALFVLIFLAVQVLFYLRRPYKPDTRPLLFALWLAFAPPALMWLASQMQPVYLERALLPSALMLYLALAWLFTRGGLPKPIAGLIGMVVLMLAGIGLYQQYRWNTFPNSPFQEAVAYARANWQDGDMIVHQNKLTALPGVYYERGLPQRFLGDAPGSREDTLALPTQQALGLLADGCIQQATQGARRVWWVTFDFVEQAYAEANRPEMRKTLDWLDGHYRLESGQHFNDVRVDLYANPQGEWSVDCGEGG